LKRKFVTNLALLLSLNLLIKPLYAFGIDVSVQNTVGASEYGKYFMLLNFSLILQILLDLGLENFNRREIARHSSLLEKYLSNIITLKLTLGVVYFAVCSAIGYFILKFGAKEFRLLSVLLFNQFLASFILYFRANLGGLHMFRTDSIISVLDRFLVIIITGILLWGNITRRAFRIEWFVYAQTVAYLLSAIVSFVIVYGKAKYIRPRFDFKYYIAVLKQCLPFALLILLMATYLRIDAVLLGKLLPDGSRQAGIYAHSYRIVEIFSNYGYLFAILLLPIFSRMIKNKEPVDQLVQLSYLLIITPAIIISISCAFFKNEIINLLYNEEKEILETSAGVFGKLIFSFLGMCTTYIFGTLITANGNLKVLNIIACIGVIISIVLNFILIPKYGVHGAAVANISTQAYMAIAQVGLSTRLFGFRINYRLIGILIIFIPLLIASGYIIKSLNINWIAGFVLIISVGILLGFVTRLINLKTLYQIIRYDDSIKN
jgi:O-antigen/teichoic acid export membrane protein